MNTISQTHKQQGAALVVGLILLVVVTVLAISGMNTATTELAMARNDQNYENAFQAAERGLEKALGTGAFNTSVGMTINDTMSVHETITADIAYEDWTSVPDQAFSLGVGSGVVAYHFIATSTAASRRDTGGGITDRDSTAVHSQAFYVVGPEGSTL